MLLTIRIFLNTKIDVIYFGRQTQRKGHLRVSFLRWLGAIVASKLALRAKRRGIRFAFEPKAVGELAHQRLGEESSLLRSKNEYPSARRDLARSA